MLIKKTPFFNDVRIIKMICYGFKLKICQNEQKNLWGKVIYLASNPNPEKSLFVTKLPNFMDYMVPIEFILYNKQIEDKYLICYLIIHYMMKS